MKPKYSIDEIERRWLVSEDNARPLLTGTPLKLTDKYLENTRLRLRQVNGGDQQTVFKLCKKYDNRNGPVESITNIYLNSDEYGLISRLPGTTVEKLRFRQSEGSIDVYRFRTGEVFIYEIEFTDAIVASAFRAPLFVNEEITGVEAYSGFALARKSNL